MSKFYSATTNGWITLSAVGGDADILELTAGSTRSIRIHQVIIAQSSDFGDAVSEGLQVNLKRFSGTFTSGSGGGAGSISPYTIEDLPTTDATVEQNNTTPAVISTGQEDILVRDFWNVQAGFNWLPTPELRVDVAPTDAFVINLSGANDDLTAAATIIYEEL